MMDGAPYFAPTIRRPKAKHHLRRPHHKSDVTRLGRPEMNLRRSPSPTKAPPTQADIVDELPHEFLARVGRGGPIDGYLPPLRLQKIAAAAAARYVRMASSRSTSDCKRGVDGNPLRHPIAVDVSHSIDAVGAAPAVSRSARPVTREDSNSDASVAAAPAVPK